MTSSPYDSFSADDLRRISTACPLASVDYHESLESTSDRALELARAADAKLPALVIASEQTAGRGRGVNQWLSSAGALTFSVAMDVQADVSVERMPVLSLASALAVCRALEQVLPAGHQIGLKWPNDVYLDGGKVCGILVETVAAPRRRIVIGIGLNVNNDLGGAMTGGDYRVETLYGATSMRFNLCDLLVTLLDHLMKTTALLSDSNNECIAESREYCVLMNRVVTVQHDQNQISGTCLGIADDGALVIQDHHGTHHIRSGTVRVEQAQTS